MPDKAYETEIGSPFPLLELTPAHWEEMLLGTWELEAKTASNFFALLRICVVDTNLVKFDNKWMNQQKYLEYLIDDWFINPNSGGKLLFCKGSSIMPTSFCVRPYKRMIDVDFARAESTQYDPVGHKAEIQKLKTAHHKREVELQDQIAILQAQLQALSVPVASVPVAVQNRYQHYRFFGDAAVDPVKGRTLPGSSSDPHTVQIVVQQEGCINAAYKVSEQEGFCGRIGIMVAANSGLPGGNVGYQ